MTHTELAWEFAELFAELPVNDINELLSKNVPLETLDFFAHYAESFGKSEGISGLASQRLANLMVVGYLLRVLEERLLEEEPDGGPPVA